jgi:hypothetical protein
MDAAYATTDLGGDGYYYFIANINKNAVPTRILINYWIQG